MEGLALGDLMVHPLGVQKGLAIIVHVSIAVPEQQKVCTSSCHIINKIININIIVNILSVLRLKAVAEHITSDSSSHGQCHQ